MTPLDHLPVDEARVDVVANVLAVAMLDNPNARDHARAVVQALDRHDAEAHIHDARGNMAWSDETEPDVDE